MKAIADHFGADEAPRLAVAAGCDLLCYRSEAAARHAYSVLSRSLEDGGLDPDRVLESADLSMDLKREFLVPYGPVDPRSAAKLVGLPENSETVKKNFG